VVVISPYREDWPAAFERIRRRLVAVLGGRALRLDHVGSTSVPGLDAHPGARAGTCDLIWTAAEEWAAATGWSP
jgi:GrpB protein